MGTDDIEHFPDARPPHYGQPKFDALRYKGKKEKIREKWRNAQASRQGWKRSKSSSDLKITQEHHKVVPSRIRDLQDIPASAVLRYETSNIRVGFLYSYMYIFLREYRLEEGVLQFQGTKFLPLAEYGLSLLRFISTRRVPLSLRGRNGKESASKSFCLFPHMQKSKSLPRLRWNDVSGKVMFESSSLENRALQSDKYWYDRKFGSHSMSLVYNCMVLPLAVSRTQSSIARQSRKAVGYLLNYLENPMSYLYKMRTYRCAISILRAIKILHPLLQPGKKRITWSCNCGHTSFDDFIELRLGAVSKYEARLRSRYAGHGSRGSLGCCAQALSLFYKGLGTSENVKHSDDHDSERQDASSRQTSRTRDQQPESSQPQARSSLFLLLCLPYMSCGTKLIQPDLRDIESDASFFRLLKTSYTEIKGQLRSRISLKTVTGIRFVQFELRKSEHVNIRKENDLPPEERRAEYLYRPMPAELIPPLGENYTMHLYHHPEHADATAATDLAQIPKKLTDRLCVCPVEGRGVGWGVHFVEGWHYNVVCLLAFALLLLASLVFLICWAVLQHDVQGASGVAAYIVAIATLSVGSVQAAFELELL
ncbi:hypothetical protein MMC17_003889 [Xylographa soralifera]|nr:hypothetical protein [Xylographa soralifera]